MRYLARTRSVRLLPVARAKAAAAPAALDLFGLVAACDRCKRHTERDSGAAIRPRRVVVPAQVLGRGPYRG